MIKGIIENTHIILSKIIKFIWFLSYCNFFKIDMYFKTERVYDYVDKLLFILLVYFV